MVEVIASDELSLISSGRTRLPIVARRDEKLESRLIREGHWLPAVPKRLALGVSVRL
jgi:hypothetical protein